MPEFLWGVSAVLAVSLVVALCDSDTRRDLRQIGAILLGIPAYLLVMAVLALLRLSGGRAYRVSGRAVRAWIDREAGAFAVERPGRTILVFTKPKPQKGNPDA